VNYKFNWAASPSAPMVYKAPSLASTVRPALAYKAPPAPPPPNWTGVYVGGDGGYGWTAASGTVADAAGSALAPYSYGAQGPFAGIFAGGNYQINQFVVGVEGDWQRSNLNGNSQQQAVIDAAASLPAATGTLPGGPFTVSTTIKDYESVRARFGIALDRFLVYGTGGWAWGDPSVSYALLGAAPLASNGGNSSGWTGGVGLEYALTDHITSRVEYRYTDLAKAGFVNVANDIADTGHHVPISDARVGFAYKFGDFALLTKD
jgi:outer membrane immunogenic protein